MVACAAARGEHRHARLAADEKLSLIRVRMPAQFADASGGEPHVHPRERSRSRQFAHGYLA